ncbi:MAG: hypothetical protein KY475_25490 [Planctomycetes bacterium]|nr:hypothetical protein [Planctomycetota bacterium]
MSFTVDLPDEWEAQVRENASAAGIAAEEFVLNAVVERLKHSESGLEEVSRLSDDESQLLAEINQGLPEAAWRRYHELVARRRAESLTVAEHEELKSLTDEVEAANVRRVAALIKLARLRHTSVRELMKDLGIQDPGYV